MPETETRVEQATLEDLPEIADLLTELFREEEDFEPDRERQERGLRLILEEPSRGRIFVIRTDHQIIGMMNLLFTISTASGGVVLLLEDMIVHPAHRRQGYGAKLMEYAVEYARQKDCLRITLLTDKISEASQNFFQKHGFQYSHMIPMRLMLDR